jgi:hypothetical protein
MLFEYDALFKTHASCSGQQTKLDISLPPGTGYVNSNVPKYANVIWSGTAAQNLGAWCFGNLIFPFRPPLLYQLMFTGIVTLLFVHCLLSIIRSKQDRMRKYIFLTYVTLLFILGAVFYAMDSMRIEVYQIADSGPWAVWKKYGTNSYRFLRSSDQAAFECSSNLGEPVAFTSMRQSLKMFYSWKSPAVASACALITSWLADGLLVSFGL